jgi:hypothetical protein
VLVSIAVKDVFELRMEKGTKKGIGIGKAEFLLETYLTRNIGIGVILYRILMGINVLIVEVIKIFNLIILKAGRIILNFVTT